MKNFTYTAILLLSFLSNSFSQTTLSAGDIAIIGVNADNPDDFAFLLLVDIEMGTEITFTDSGIKTDGTFRGGEGGTKFTAGSAYNAGTVLSYVGNSGEFASANDATIGNNGFVLSASGDQIFAFQGTTSSPTFIFAVQTNSTLWQNDATASTNSSLPTSLTSGTNAVAVGAGTGSGSEYDNSVYDESVTSGDKATLLAAICNNSNWDGSNSRITFSFSSYSVTGASSTWTGNTNTDWTNSNNWDNGVPTSSMSATIPNVGNAPIIGSSTNANTKDITINNSASLTISKSGSLTISET